METYIKNNELLDFGSTDVLVCGGGPAGFGAAIRAAREGVKVMIVEHEGCLGGIATAGMMSHWGGRSSSKIMREIFSRSIENQKIVNRPGKSAPWDCEINQESQKIVLEEMALEAGIEILYYSLVCGAIVEDEKIKGVIIQNKSGRGIIKAKCVIDSTGDGDVAYYAGVPYFKGRETDGKMQPCTLMFKLGGVDMSRAVLPGSFETKVPTENGELQELGKKLLPFPAGHVLLYHQTTDDTVCVNMTNAIDIDGTDAKSLTKGMEICRSQITPIIDFLHKYAPGYENCWLMSSGSLLGIRETRHFEGVKTLTPEDILQANKCEDWCVKRAWFNFDVHNMSGSSLDKTGVQHGWKQPDDYSIPYGCLLPKNIEGLLLSGRNISGSHLAHSNYRIMSVCIALGEAAGVAGALFVKENLKSLKNVDVKKIQVVVGE